MKKISIFLIMLLFLTSCSIQKTQKNDNNDKELRKNMQLLNRDNISEAEKNNAKKNISILLNEKILIAKELRKKNDSEAAEVALEELEKINLLLHLLEEVDTSFQNIGDDCEKEIVEVKQNIIAEKIKTASLLENDTSRLSAVNAYLTYKKAAEIAGEMSDSLAQKIRNVYDKALICIYLQKKTSENFPQGFAKIFFEKISDECGKINKTPFTNLSESNSECSPKYFLTLSLSEPDFERAENLRQTFVVKDSLLISDKEDKQKVYQNYFAEITKFTNLLSFKALMTVSFSDKNQKLLFEKKIPFSKKIRTQRARFRGDSRALTQELFDLCQNAEIKLPPDEFFFKEIIAELQFSFSEQVNYFLKGL